MNQAKIAKLCNEIEDNAMEIRERTMSDSYFIAQNIIDKSRQIAAEITAPPKTNREKLTAQSLYDLLCDMNASFMNGKPHCVLEAITGENMICKHESCNQCIANYLNEYQFQKEVAE